MYKDRAKCFFPYCVLVGGRLLSHYRYRYIPERTEMEKVCVCWCFLSISYPSIWLALIPVLCKTQLKTKSTCLPNIAPHYYVYRFSSNYVLLSKSRLLTHVLGSSKGKLILHIIIVSLVSYPLPFKRVEYLRLNEWNLLFCKTGCLFPMSL